MPDITLHDWCVRILKCKTVVGWKWIQWLHHQQMMINLIKYLLIIDSFDSELIDSFSSLSCSNWMFFPIHNYFRSIQLKLKKWERERWQIKYIYVVLLIITFSSINFDWLPIGKILMQKLCFNTNYYCCCFLVVADVYTS